MHHTARSVCRGTRSPRTSPVKRFDLISSNSAQNICKCTAVRIKYPPDALTIRECKCTRHTHRFINRHTRTHLGVPPFPVVRCLCLPEGFVIWRGCGSRIPGGPPLIYVIVCIFSLFKGHLVSLLCSAFICCCYCCALTALVSPSLFRLYLKTHSALCTLSNKPYRLTRGKARNIISLCGFVKTVTHNAVNLRHFYATLLEIARDYPSQSGYVDLLSNCQ